VNITDAEALIATAVPRQTGSWADMGAGGGTFSRALARRLGSGSRIYAVDRDHDAIASLQDLAMNGVEVVPVLADFTRTTTLAGVRGLLDGMLFANSLHFVAKPEDVLGRLITLVRTGGRVVIVEYDGRRPSRWVPYPISSARLLEIVARTGLAAPLITAARPSQYGGSLYVAVTQRD
jgi:2-polyprenyl-3-methyl-5-hydroxy-6-metoxy-1,4-benzoquinol methylase